MPLRSAEQMWSCPDGLPAVQWLTSDEARDLGHGELAQAAQLVSCQPARCGVTSTLA
ncbi:hypothetical protein [Lentzea kentuckyensis]|uniref:hypothetical protein n=1 Tax=Lentzea kentuckyensis TaxID=360086 RepID=UPI0013026D46|nr:hypothetical protein [Lentzea kentuckyensis]